MAQTPSDTNNRKRPLLDVKNVVKQFGGLTAVSDFNITIFPGELVGLIGPNGAGKTTVFNLITGVYTPTEGRIYIDTKPTTGLTPDRITAMGIARTFQNIRLFEEMSVLENVKTAYNLRTEYGWFASIFRTKKFRAAEARTHTRSMELLKTMGLDDQADERSASLAYGEQRRLEIARALATEPKLLILDEPAAGMNPQETEELMDMIRDIRTRFNLTLLIIEHDMKFIMRLCERIIVLDRGKIIAKGTPQEVKSSPTVIAAYLGDSADHINLDGEAPVEPYKPQDTIPSTPSAKALSNEKTRTPRDVKATEPAIPTAIKRQVTPESVAAVDDTEAEENNTSAAEGLGKATQLTPSGPITTPITPSALDIAARREPDETNIELGLANTAPRTILDPSSEPKASNAAPTPFGGSTLEIQAAEEPPDTEEPARRLPKDPITSPSTPVAIALAAHKNEKESDEDPISGTADTQPVSQETAAAAIAAAQAMLAEKEADKESSDELDFKDTVPVPAELANKAMAEARAMREAELAKISGENALQHAELTPKHNFKDTIPSAPEFSSLKNTLPGSPSITTLAEELSALEQSPAAAPPEQDEASTEGRAATMLLTAFTPEASVAEVEVNAPPEYVTETHEKVVETKAEAETAPSSSDSFDEDSSVRPAVQEAKRVEGTPDVVTSRGWTQVLPAIPFERDDRETEEISKVILPKTDPVAEQAEHDAVPSKGWSSIALPAMEEPISDDMAQLKKRLTIELPPVSRQTRTTLTSITYKSYEPTPEGSEPAPPTEAVQESGWSSIALPAIEEEPTSQTDALQDETPSKDEVPESGWSSIALPALEEDNAPDE